MSHQFRRYFEGRTNDGIHDDVPRRRKSNVIVLPSVWDGHEDTDSEFLSLATEATEVSLPSIHVEQSLRKQTPVLHRYSSRTAHRSGSEGNVHTRTDTDVVLSSGMSRLGQGLTRSDANFLTISSCSLDGLKTKSEDAQDRVPSSTVNQLPLDHCSDGEDSVDPPSIVSETERTVSKSGCCTCPAHTGLLEQSRRSSNIAVMDTQVNKTCSKCGKPNADELSRTQSSLKSPSNLSKSVNQSRTSLYSVQESAHPVESSKHSKGHTKKLNRGLKTNVKVRAALPVGVSPLPSVNTNIHRDAYNRALSDSGALRFSKDPWTFHVNYNRPYFSYFPVWKNPLPLGELNLKLGLKPRKMKLNVKNGMAHILGPMKLGDYYPGGTKFTAKTEEKPTQDRE